MEAGKAIYYLLKNSTDVGAICGDRIYPEIAQQTASAPFIIYTIQSAKPSGTKGGTSTVDAVQFEIITVSSDYGQAMSLGTAARSALDRVGGVINGVQVQSIDFKTQAVDYDFSTEHHMLVQTYDMRLSFTGTAGSYSAINVVATYKAIQCTFAEQQKTGGSGAILVQGTTPVRLAFSSELINTSSIFSLNGTYGIITITAGGIYRVTAQITFTAEQTNVEPHIFGKVESREFETRGTGFIKGGSNNDHGTAQFTELIEVNANERLSVWAYDDSDSTGGVTIDHAVWIIEQVATS